LDLKIKNEEIAILGEFFFCCQRLPSPPPINRNCGKKFYEHFILWPFLTNITWGGASTQPFWPPNQSPFSLKYKQNIGKKWNFEGRFDILVTISNLSFIFK
jgi:hypothetical protein